MSRRITFVALAASVSLIATQAAADRECFEDSCRVQETAEPQAQTTLEVAAPANKTANNPIPDFVARFSRRIERCGPMASTRNGKSPITAAIIRSAGRAGPATIVSTPTQ